ncbi:MmpS family transport accessory protein [Streptomyces sp. NPDC005791]|uniref:MmpS family transport accessory protein n=1 Tax=unclassified Streptomyces TaxID=2593676 RepID=UPI0033EA9EF4
MNRTMRTTHVGRTTRVAASALTVGGLVLGLNACSEAVDKVVDETYEVTYEVTGTSVDEIQYHGGKGRAMKPEVESVEAPGLPWKKTVTLRGIMPPAVMPIALDAGSEDLACTITYEGEVIEEMKGEALLTSGGCVAVSPVAD